MPTPRNLLTPKWILLLGVLFVFFVSSTISLVTQEHGQTASNAGWHWRNRRPLVLDRATSVWEKSNQRAVGLWNNQHAGVTLVWGRGDEGSCAPLDGVIVICETTGLNSAYAGLTTVVLEPDQHLRSAVIQLNSARNTRSQAYRDEIICHEMGHALGLGHSTNRGSCMYPTGPATTVPDAADGALLREIYSHSDGPAPPPAAR